MPKSKLTLIVDGNWLLMSRLPVLLGKYADERTLIQDVKLLMLKSISVVLRTFPSIDNVMFVSDGGSWRKDEPRPEWLKDRDGEELEYKGNRVKDEKVINWDMVFAEYDNFLEKIAKGGIATFHENAVEGDDWCWYWSQRLNAEGTNVVIWTKDRDITQLVKSDKNGCFTVVWNKDNGIFMKSADENDMTNFLLNPYYQMNEKLLSEIIQGSANKINYVNPVHVKLDKIIRGDKADNISPIMTRHPNNGKTDRIFRLNDKHLPDNLDIYNTKEVTEWIENTVNSDYYRGKILEPTDEIINHFMYNRKLVVLDEKSYPERILETLHKYDDWIYDHPLCADCSNAESIINAQKNDIIKLLNII